jgi:hypothetical protein
VSTSILYPQRILLLWLLLLWLLLWLLDPQPAAADRLWSQCPRV